MVYSIEADGSIKDLLNHENIKDDWQQLRSEIPNHELFKESKREVIDQIIKVGDVEYNSKPLLVKNSGSNLFNKIIFGQYLTFDFDDFEI